jgi:hypothetical protein
VDAQLSRPLTSGFDGRSALELLRAGLERGGGAQQVPLLRQDDELGTVPGRIANEGAGALEVPGLVGRRIELDCGGAQRRSLSSGNH